MTDIISKEKRSDIMRLIRSKNTKPEILVRKHLHAHGFRFRIHDKSLICKPDVKLTKFKTVIFINGCFWHGHYPCGFFKTPKIPKSNAKYWSEKIKKNKSRDENALQILSEFGWKVIFIWECELSKNNIDKRMGELIHQIRYKY